MCIDSDKAMTTFESYTPPELRKHKKKATKFMNSAETFPLHDTLECNNFLS